MHNTKKNDLRTVPGLQTENRKLKTKITKLTKTRDKFKKALGELLDRKGEPLRFFSEDECLYLSLLLKIPEFNMWVSDLIVGNKGFNQQDVRNMVESHNKGKK